LKGGEKMKNKKGFTLIELLVVIAIIGILSAIGLVALNGAREKARDAQRRSDLAQMRTAMTLYYDDHSSLYPGVTGGLPDESACVKGGAQAGVWAAGGLIVGDNKYLATVLTSPSCGDNAKGQYFYDANENLPTGATEFILYTQLEGSGGNYYYSINQNGNVVDVAETDSSQPACASAGGLCAQ
jgi:prepilin-type N-terminal cleavage/methylation domain-containing protein